MASCLIKPNTLYGSSDLPGQHMIANDQCKLTNTNSASFCQVGPINYQSSTNLKLTNMFKFTSKDMCSNLYCRYSINDTQCFSSKPALDGTTCGSGKACISGVCQVSSLAPVSECPFGDDVVTNGTFGVHCPTYQVTCQKYFDLLESKKMSIDYYCSTTNGNIKCCQSCLSNY